MVDKERMVSNRWPREAGKKRFVLAAVLTAASVMVPAIRAQLPPSASPLTATTPGINTPGSPDGVYALSNFDTINLANGAMSFVLPLVHVPGRGNAKTTLNLRFGLNWRVNSMPSYANCQNQNCDIVYSYSVVSTPWHPLFPRYGFGMMVMRKSGDGTTSLAPGGPDCIWHYALTRLTYIAPDGTETEFRDSNTGGQPEPGSQPGSEFDRGTVWVANDGSAATYTSTGHITDPNLCQNGTGAAGDGVLQTRDGTTYRIQAGYVTQISDRNGNTVTSTVDSNGVQSITDSYGRLTTVTLASASGVPTADTIAYPSSAGIVGTECGNATCEHVVVNYSNLQSLLRNPDTMGGKTADELFPNVCSAAGLINCLQSGPVDANGMVSEVDLPNGTAFKFKYDAYGNVARVELPTGGAYEYDYSTTVYSASLGGGYSGGHAFTIQSAISQKRIYKNLNDSTAEQTVSYNYGVGTFQGRTVPVTTATQADNSKEAHTFMGFLNTSPTLSGIYYNDWPEGKEVQTDYYDTDGATILRTEQTTFQQRDCSTGAPCWFVGSNGLICHNNCVASVNDFSAPAHDARVTETVTTLDSGEVKQDVYAYDAFNNRTDTSEYGYGTGAAGPLIRRRNTTFSTGFKTGSVYILDRPTQETIFDANSKVWSQTSYTYDENVLGNLANPVEHSPDYLGVFPAVTFDSNYTSRGNVTTVAKWASNSPGTLSSVNTSSCSSTVLCSKFVYDIAGNVTRSIDPRGVQDDYEYVDNPADIRNSYSLPTKITSYQGLNATQNVSSIPTGVSFVAMAAYNYDVGKATSTKDVNGTVNGNTSSYSYADHLGRLTGISTPDGGSTSFVYTDTPNAVAVTANRSQRGGVTIQTMTAYDGLGRKSVTTANEGTSGGSASAIKVQQAYDSRGRVLKVSNPYRSSATEWTTSSYDGLGRAILTTLPDGSVSSSMFYGSKSLAVDPALNNRQFQTDALGRLAQVIENQTSWTKKVGTGTVTQSVGQSGQPSFTTAYGFDVLDNLIAVTADTQGRSFSYDSLKRLLTAMNPESGTITYTYDMTGNVATRVGLRNLTATMAYDGLNRVLTKQYSDTGSANPTPWVTYSYDQGGAAVNALGRLTQVLSAQTAVSWGTVPQVTRNYGSFDAMGRVTASSQTIGNNTPYAYTYGYDLAGELTSEGYPSGRTVATGYDVAGRLASVAGTLNSTTTAYATLPTDPVQAYTQYGTLYQLPLINGVTETSTYNNRLQLTGLTATKGSTELLNLGFSYAGGGLNNGNMLGQTIRAQGATGPTWNQTFLYDAYNRLCAAGEGVTWAPGTSCAGLTGTTSNPWWQTYSFDQWGNRAVAGTMPNADWTPRDLTKYTASRWIRQAGGGDGYDAEGNQISVASNTSPGTASSSFTFDAENRMASANAMNTGAVNYVYDGEGHRVEKLSGSTVLTTYVYDASGELTSEYGAVGSTGTEYPTADHLGSTRLVTDGRGIVLRRYDYMPFGEEIGAGTGGRGSDYSGTGTYPAPADSITDRKFSGKIRDFESGLDYFESRYYSSAQGRFTSPDEFKGGFLDAFTGQHEFQPGPLPYADITDPQTLNKYAYVRNNPLRYIDPDGHDRQDSWDVLVGVGRGIASSITYGYVGAPNESDSLASRTGQAIGSAMVASTGVDLTVGGSAGGLVTAPTVVGAAAGAAVAGAGLAISGGAAKNIAAMALVKPASGKGSVSPDQRDPKRSMSPKEKTEKLAEQKGNCAHCDKPIEGENGIAHHDPVRHADGGKEMKIVHKACHDELHCGS